MPIMYIVSTHPENYFPHFPTDRFCEKIYRAFDSHRFLVERFMRFDDSCIGLENSLRDLGFIINKEGLPQDCSFSFRAVGRDELHASLRSYFGFGLSGLKEAISKMTPEEFMTQQGADSIAELVESTCSQILFKDGEFYHGYTGMGFLRQVSADTLYYVSKLTILLS